MPTELTWDCSADLAYMIDGYSLIEEAGLGEATAFLEERRTEAERAGQWKGSALELWLALFLEHRRDHFESGGPIGLSTRQPDPPLLDELCHALIVQLRR